MHPFFSHRNDMAQRSNATALNGNSALYRDGLVRRWLQSAKRNWKQRKMVAALQALDDHLLGKLGIDRGDIDRIVDGFNDQELRMVPFTHSPRAALHDAETLSMTA